MTRQLVLSLFPGIGMLDRGFERAGFCVVRGPDTLWGGDVREFHAPACHFSGVIGGPPCQDFSAARRAPRTGHGIAMLKEFARVIIEAQPSWWLMENVPRVPTLDVHGYQVQRFDFNATAAAASQNRPRHFQFGSREGMMITPPRLTSRARSQPTCTATEARRAGRRAFPDFCELQGLPRDFDLPGFTIEEKYRAVGNGVHVAVSTAIAVAIVHQRPSWMTADCCACGCGRQILGREKSAGPACRKRLERSRRGTSQPRLAAA
jgi:DNA (cytosine-5)-methyltransferase 1